MSVITIRIPRRDQPTRPNTFTSSTNSSSDFSCFHNAMPDMSPTTTIPKNDLNINDTYEILDKKYRILSLINSGGTAKVYRAKILDGSNRIFAIKKFMLDEIRSELLTLLDSEQKVSLLRIPEITEIFAVDRRGLVVMEHVPGITLAAKLRFGVSEVEAFSLMLGFCNAVSKLHENGLIHLDLKPSNAIITQNMIKLIDFSLVRDTKTFGSRSGTPRYMSPEQHEGGVCDERSDIYSLGVIFAEMLSGEASIDIYDNSLFMADSAHISKSRGRLEEQLKKLQDHLDHIVPAYEKISDNFKSIIFTCTDLNPSNRFSNLAELLAALRSY